MTNSQTEWETRGTMRTHTNISKYNFTCTKNTHAHTSRNRCTQKRVKQKARRGEREREVQTQKQDQILYTPRLPSMHDNGEISNGDIGIGHNNLGSTLGLGEGGSHPELALWAHRDVCNAEGHAHTCVCMLGGDGRAKSNGVRHPPTSLKN